MRKLRLFCRSAVEFEKSTRSSANCYIVMPVRVIIMCACRRFRLKRLPSGQYSTAIPLYPLMTLWVMIMTAKSRMNRTGETLREVADPYSCMYAIMKLAKDG